MALSFIIGTAGTGKTYFIMEEMIKRQSLCQGRQILIVPEQFTAQAERDLIQKSPGGATLSAEVLSFGRLAYQVFAKGGLNKKTPLSDIGKYMALQKILLSKKDRLSFFGSVSDKSGFIDQLSLSISELFQYHITPEILSEKAQNPTLPRSAREKLDNMSVIYQSFLDFLAQDTICADERLTLLAKYLDRDDSLRTTEIWLDGFYGFTPQEYGVIRGLLRLCPTVSISLPMDKKSFEAAHLTPSAIFYEPHVTKNKLTLLAEEKDIAISKPLFFETNKRAKTVALRELESAFPQGYYKKCSLKESVSITSCATAEKEIAFAAGSIVRLVRSESIRYRDIAIVTNAMASYEKSISAILREYGIPYFIDTPREITTHPLISMIEALLDIWAYDFKYENVFSYLKSGLAPFSAAEVDVLENYILAYGIKGYKWRKDKWEYGLKKEGEETIALMNNFKDRFMQPFTPLLELKKKRTFPLNELLDDIREHISLLGVTDTLSSWREEAMSQGNMAKAAEHKQIWNLLSEVFKNASAILGDTLVTPEEGGKILSAGIQKCTMGIIPPTGDCVVVGDIERSRLPDIKYLFVLGVNEGILPAPSRAQGVFTEAERSALASLGMELAADSKRKTFEEQFLIYRGLTKPSHGLYLTFANAKSTGESLFPSSLIDRLRRMDNDLKIQAYKGFSIDEAVPASAIHLLGEKMRCHSPETPMDAVWMDIYSFFASDTAWDRHTSLLCGALSDKKQDDRLAEKTAKLLYGDKIFSSVSRLERFAACPFSYFAEYGLKAEERRLYQLHTPDLGLLFHEVLELFSNRLRDENIHWDRLTQPQTETMIHEAVDIAAPRLGESILLDSAANQYLIRRLKRISARAAWAMVKHLQTGDFVPAGYEIAFGEHGSLPPIEILLEGGQRLILSGKIDRVDILSADGKQFVKIIDYKSGSKAFQFQDIYYGLQLQLLVYLDAYLKHFRKNKVSAEAGGVFYFRITDPAIAVNTDMSAEDIQKELYKKMKMSGLLLADDIVLKGIDHSFEGGTAGISSNIVPISFTKKGEPAAAAMLATKEQYDALLEFVVNRAAKIGAAMGEGSVAASPYRKGDQTPCTYCRYRSVCRYDCGDEPRWRDLKKISKNGFWEEIMPFSEN